MKPQFLINNNCIEFKDYKSVKWMSEETVCFEAKLYLNGKYVANVKNDGHGGEDDIEVLDSDRWAMINVMASTLDPKKYGWQHREKLEATSLLCLLVDKCENAKVLKSNLKRMRKTCEKGLSWINSGESLKDGWRTQKVDSWSVLTDAQKQRFYDMVLKKFTGATIINLMTDEEILNQI